MPPPKKYSITVDIEQTTLDILRKDPCWVLVLVREMQLGDSNSQVEQGNVVFAAIELKELSNGQKFTWQECYNVAETTEKFKVSVYILLLLHTTDDWHVGWHRSPVAHTYICHFMWPESYSSWQ